MTTPNLEQCRRGGQARIARLREQLQTQGLTLSDYQREIRARVSSEACRANGAKGAAATLARHGYAALHAKVVAYRLAHPSEPERRMIAILDDLGYHYEREYSPFNDEAHRFLTVDFFLRGFGKFGKAIEVNGKVHSGETLFNPDGRRPRAEAEKLAAIRQAGIPVLVIEARELVDGERVASRVRQFLTGAER